MPRHTDTSLATHHGLGTHVWLLPFATGYATVKASIQVRSSEHMIVMMAQQMQYLYIAQVLYACAIAFTKIAIIASYLRFIQDGMFRLAMYGTGFVIISLWFTGQPPSPKQNQCSPSQASSSQSSNADP